MKKRIGTILIAAVLLFSLLLSACTDTTPSETPTQADTTATEAPAESKYTVSVVDWQGNGITNVIVKAMQGGEMVAMKVVKENGLAAFDFTSGEYDVQIEFPGEAAKNSYYYDTANLKMTDEAPALTVTMYNAIGAGEDVTAYSKVRDQVGTMSAYQVKEGATYVDLQGEERAYFVFRPSRTGIYKVSFISKARIEIGYYGIPQNGMKNSIAEVENNAFELEIRKPNLVDPVTPYLIGLLPKSVSTKSCILTIERIGEPEFDPADEPWISISANASSLKDVNYLNWEFKNFTDLDITNQNLQVVYNESDGYYHYGSAEGPVVYIRLDSTGKYLSGSISDIIAGEVLGAYFYNDDGSFNHREHYNVMFEDYLAVCDTLNGACPLNKQIADAIVAVGNYRGWWNPESHNYLFADYSNVVLENAWLFLCGYYPTVEKDVNGTTAADAIHLRASGSVMLGTNQTVYFTNPLSKDCALTIKTDDAGLKVIYGGKEYTAKDGYIRLTVAAKQGFSIQYGGTASQIAVNFTSTGFEAEA